MVTLKNNPYEILRKEGINKESLSVRVQKGLQIYDETLEDLNKYPKDKQMRQAAEEIGSGVCELMRDDVERLRQESYSEEEEKGKKAARKAQSKSIIAKAEKTLDDLTLCRQRLKEDRQKKIDSGEIKKPVKKTLSSKLRAELVKMATLIPTKLKDDVSVIQKTRKAVLNFLSELKSIWGLDKIKPIQEEIMQKFDKLEEKASEQ